MAITKMSNLGIASLGSEKYNDMLAGNPPFIPTDYESIATASGTGSSGTITFSSIPSTYKHLEIRQISRVTVASSDCNLRFNSDTGANYSWHRLMGNGSSASAASGVSNTYIELPSTSYSSLLSNTYGTSVTSILDYANTNKFKTVRSLGGFEDNSSGFVLFCSGNWRSTSAVTSISLITGSGSWTTDTHFALYGIKE
jgi:hypothetical protein